MSKTLITILIAATLALTGLVVASERYVVYRDQDGALVKSCHYEEIHNSDEAPRGVHYMTLDYGTTHEKTMWFKIIGPDFPPLFLEDNNPSSR